MGAIFILIVGTLGFLIYSKWGTKSSVVKTDTTQKSAIPDTGASPSGDTGGGIPDTTPPAEVPPSSSVVNKLSSDPIYNPFLFYEGNAIYYFDRDGKVYQSGLVFESGKAGRMTDPVVFDYPDKANISKVLLSPKGNDYIVEIDTGLKKRYSYFSSQLRAFIDFPENIISVDWLPQDNKVVYVWLDNNKATLNISDPDTQNWKKISDMWEPDNHVDVSPNGQVILFYRTLNSAASSNSINLVTPDGKTWQELIKDGYNFGTLWSPDSKKFLFNKREAGSLKYQLYSYELESGNTQNLGLFTTVDKVVWGKDSKTIYAAVPKSESSDAGSGSFTKDDFYSMDITDLTSKKPYLTGESAVDGRNLFLSIDNARLFFKNAQDGFLYYLDLSK